MLLPANATLIISVARQLIKLGNRIDNLLAEKTAVQSELVLSLPRVRIDDIVEQKKRILAALDSTASDDPDPFAPDRVIIIEECGRDPVTPRYDQLVARYFPDLGGFEVVDPDAAFLAKLKQVLPGTDWNDPAVRIAAFAIASGPDPRGLGYSARIALSVADTILEFGAEHAATFVRDEKLAGVLTTVLQRLAEPDWDRFENWNPLLQSVLRATLNAALDVGERLPTENPWLAGVLDALAAARKNAAVPDDFVLGLVRGEGFPLLLSEGLLVASNHLATDQSRAFKVVAADMLAEGAAQLKKSGRASFRKFFENHWGDLLRAGLASIDKHGDAILDDQNPLLAGVLKAMVKQLAVTADADFLTGETLARLTDSAIAVVAANPAEVNNLSDKSWLTDLINTAARSARELTANKLFTRESAEALLLDAVAVLGRHPQLIIERQGLPLTIVTDVLQSVGQLTRVDRRELAQTTIAAALGAIGRDPSLAGGKFGPTLAAVVSHVSTAVGDGAIDSSEAQELVRAAVDATLRNPEIFAGLDKDIATAAINAVRDVLSTTAEQPWSKRMLVDVARGTLFAIARTGAEKALALSETELADLLGETLAAGIARAEEEIGHTIDLEDVPRLLAALVERALRGELTLLDPKSAEFTELFGDLAAALPRP